MKQKIISFGTRRSKATPRRQAAGRVRAGRRRTGRQALNYLLILLVAGAIMLALSMTVFFKIETIDVDGNTKYAPQALIEASGVKQGDNLFRVNEQQVNKRLVEKYAYIASVELVRHFPARLTLRVTQEKPLGAVDTAAGYVVVGSTGRVLEVGAKSLPDGLTVVTGMYLYEPKVGQQLGSYGKEQQEHAELEKEGFRMLSYLVEAVNETAFQKITMVDFSDRLNMMLVYDDRIIVELGSEAELAFKLNFVSRLIQNELPENFEGILDASSAQTSRNVWSDPCDVQAELEQRRLTAAAKANSAQTPGAAQPVIPDAQNPDFAVKPGTGAAASSSGVSSDAATSSGVSSNAAASSSSAASSEGYTQDDLAVKPGTGQVSSASETSDVPQEGA